MTKIEAISVTLCIAFGIAVYIAVWRGLAFLLWRLGS